MDARTLLIAYGAGALIALWRSDARPFERIALAVLWPIGPLAFIATVALLVATSPLAFLPKR
jgi:hypothetical protein